MATPDAMLERARALDAADPLAGFRDRFAIPDGDTVYFDGNSLGRPPRTALEAARATTHEWADALIRGWDGGWLDEPRRLGARLATGVLGAAGDEVVVADSTTVNLYRLAVAALEAVPTRRAIVIERGEFPTDRYVAEGLARERDLQIHWLDGDPVEGLATGDVVAALGPDVGLVIISAVHYRSAARLDIAAITSAARDAGAFVLWDLSHAAGSVPVELGANRVDLAVGCTYKYLNGGPGAPAFLYVRRELQERLRPPIQGWFAQRDQFEMGPGFERRDGIAGWLVGTPGIVGLRVAEAGIALAAEAGVDRIHAKGIALTEFAIQLHDGWLARLGCTLGSPRDPRRRGAHVSIRHPEARRLTRALIARNVLPDFRAPDSIRIGLSPLSTSFEEVHRGLSVLRALLEG